MKDKLRFLQIDTSNEDFLFIKLNNREVSDHVFIDIKRCHLKELIPSIHNLLDKNKLKLSDLDFIALNEGPGSWTGLRIGYSTVKIICLVNKIKLITYNNFEIIRHKNLNLNGIYLVKASNEKYYYLIVRESEIDKTGIASETEILDLYSNFEKFYLEDRDFNCDQLILQKYIEKDFKEPLDIEPFYIGEGVILK